VSILKQHAKCHAYKESYISVTKSYNQTECTSYTYRCQFTDNVLLQQMLIRPLKIAPVANTKQHWAQAPSAYYIKTNASLS